LLLCGCGPEPKAPSPTVNPNAHEFTKLKISVEPDSGVTGVRVESLWTVGNLGCAPTQSWPSGAPIIKQVNVLEKVEKLDANNYLITTVDDRFLNDKCEWRDGGYGIDFMRYKSVLSSAATGKSRIEQAGVLKLTCETDVLVPPAPPVCFMRDREAFLKSRHYRIFNATVEIEQ
jgi:hypothetical protein